MRGSAQSGFSLGFRPVMRVSRRRMPKLLTSRAFGETLPPQCVLGGEVAGGALDAGGAAAHAVGDELCNR